MRNEAASPIPSKFRRLGVWFNDKNALLDLWIAVGVGGPGLMVALVGAETLRLWLAGRLAQTHLPAFSRDDIVGDVLTRLPTPLGWALVLLGTGLALITVSWRLVRARREVLRLRAG